MNEILHRLALAQASTRVAAWQRIRRFGSAEACHSLAGVRPDLRRARRIVARAEALGARALLPDRDSELLALRDLPDPPLLLWVRGPLEARPALAIVGSRRATARARATAHALAQAAAAAGACVVSGLAYGVDAAAHEGALAAGGTTLAVLASGVDAATPLRNRGLARRILAGGGAWLSEHPPGTPALPHHFPERNRLISGLARATLIVEARERSGSLWTARHALEQGRDVLVVPGPIDTDACRGSNALLRDGAAPVLDADDLLHAAFGWTAPATACSGRLDVPEDAAPEIRRVLETLAEGPQDLDRLAQLADLSSARLSGVLLELELERRIVREGRRVSLRGAKPALCSGA